MNFVSLKHILDELAALVPPRIDPMGPDGEDWDKARRYSGAAAKLHQSLLNHDAEAPCWVAVHPDTRLPVFNMAVRDEALDMLVHAAGWSDRLGQAWVSHVRDSSSLWIDPGTNPQTISVNDGLFRLAQITRSGEIGLDRDRFREFVRGCCDFSDSAIQTVAEVPGRLVSLQEVATKIAEMEVVGWDDDERPLIGLTRCDGLMLEAEKFSAIKWAWESLDIPNMPVFVGSTKSDWERDCGAAFRGLLEKAVDECGVQEKLEPHFDDTASARARFAADVVARLLPPWSRDSIGRPVTRAGNGGYLSPDEMSVRLKNNRISCDKPLIDACSFSLRAAINDRKSTCAALSPDAGVDPPDGAEKRRARRYQICVDAGLKMPTSSLGPMPRGIGRIAKLQGISRQAFTQDLKAHIDALNSK